MPQRYGPAPALDGQLTAEDYGVNPVHIRLQDGGVCRFRHAFYAHQGEWIAVYSEHSGYHMFHLSRISSVKGLVRTD